MRVILVVIPEPPVYRRQHCGCIGQWVDTNIIPLERFDKAFREAVGFRASDGGKARLQAEAYSKVQRFFCRVAASVIAQELRRELGFQAAKALLHCLQHQVAHHITADATIGYRIPANRLTVKGINDKGDAHRFTVPAGNLEPVRTPAQVGAHDDHLTFMSAACASGRVLLQQPALHGHDSEHPLVVDRRKSLLMTLFVKQAGDAPVAVGGALIHYLTYFLGELGILCLAVAAPLFLPTAQSVHQV